MQQNIPHDPDLESALIATALLDPFDGAIICNQLPHDVFFSQKIRAIHSAINEVVHGKGDSTDLMSIKASLQKQYGLGKEITVSDLMEIIERFPVCTDLPSNIRRAINLFEARTAQRGLHELHKKILSDPENVSGHISAFLSSVKNGFQSQEIKTVSGADLLRNEPPLPKQILPDMVDRKDKTAIIGPSKTKKSMVVNQLGLCLTAGIDFLNWKSSHKFRVSICQFEITKDHYHRRLRRLSKALGIKPDDIGDRLQVINARGLNITGVKGIERISRAVSIFKPDLIIFDPLYKLADGVENAAEDMKVILAAFDELAETSGAAILYVHHDTKGNQGEKDIRDRGAGSGVLGRDYDCCIALTPHSQNNDAMVIDIIQRNYRPVDPFCILWTCDESGGAYCFKMADNLVPEKKTVRTKAAPPPLTVYLPIAEKILSDGEMELAIFKSEFKDMTGLGDNRIRDFLNWSTAGGSPYLITQEVRGKGFHKKWVKLSQKNI
jgi:hypothetical protein